MSQQKVQIFEFRCDGGCGLTARVEYLGDHDRPSSILPEGWKRRAVHGCGMTNYTRHDELCPVCFVRHEEVEAKEKAEAAKK